MAALYSGRTEQRKAAVQRRLDAKVLRDGRRWRGAMYSLGYAVECSLKSKLMERYGCLQLSDLQNHLSQRLGRPLDLHTHSLHDLMNWTESLVRIDRTHRVNWGIVRKWQVAWRYAPHDSGEVACQEFFDAADVVLRFVQNSI